MKLINFCILLLLFSCQGKNNSTIAPLAKTAPAKQVSKLTEFKLDTSYTSIVFKIDQKDSIVIRRIYYNKKDFGYYHQEFLLNGKQVYVDTVHNFESESKYNRIIKDKGNIFLFFENGGSPNFNFISAFSLKDKTIAFIADCVYNNKDQRGGSPPFTDIDKDGYLEFGGFDLTEEYSNPDSMYYLPSQFYEIRNGKVQFDSLLTRTKDIKENGVYIENPIDHKGYCCVIIKKPKTHRRTKP